jgi:hypothetical protein
MIRSPARSAFLLTAMLATTLCASAKNIYVSTTGNDNNSGAAAGSPLRTIAAASGRAAPGDTVYLLPGQYSEAIVPANSGTSGHPITYQSAGPTPAVISNVKVGVLISSKAFIVINGINVNGGTAAPNATVGTFVVVQNSNNVIIQNGKFQYANGWAGFDISGLYSPDGTYYAFLAKSAMANGSTTYVTIEDNTIDNVGNFLANKGDVIQVGFAVTQNILIQRNTLTHGGHDLLDLESDYSVVQDNTFNNSYKDLFGANAGYRSYEMGGTFNVFQRNFVSQSGVSGNGRLPPLITPRGSQNITRLNVLANGIQNGINTWCGPPSATSVTNDHIYNNTLYQLGGAAWIVWAFTGCDTVGHDVFANNLVVNSRMTPGPVANVSIGGPNPDADIEFSVSGGSGVINAGLGPTAQSVVKGNLFAPSGGGPAVVNLGAGGQMTLAAAAAQYPQLFIGNIEARPTFASANPAAKSDFQLQPGSRGIASGVFLTNVVATGNSTQVPVGDSLYFSDGNGVNPGDTIQLQGSTQTSQIVSINRSTNTLTLASSFSFKSGQGVALAYNGAAPDIGAGGPAASTVQPQPPASLSATQQQ